MRGLTLTILSLCCVVALTVAQGFYPTPLQYDDADSNESGGGLDLNFFFLLFFLVYVYFKESTRVRNVAIQNANISLGV